MQQSTSIIVSFRVDSLLELGGRGTRSKIVGTPVFYKGRIYVGSGQEAEHGEGPGRLVCLDPTKTGDISSQLAVNADGRQLPIRRLQAVVAENKERAINAQSGEVHWTYDLFSGCWCGPLIV